MRRWVNSPILAGLACIANRPAGLRRLDVRCRRSIPRERKLPERRDVTLENWLDAPYNRWGFIHVRELTRTARISRGDGPIFELPRDERDQRSFTFAHDGEKISFPQMFESTSTDGLLILHGRRFRRLK